MKVSKITIDNILGIEHLELEPGRVTVISGQNGAGKTSVLEAIRAALGGGTDASLIRKGQASAKSVVILDSGESIQRKITADGTTVQVTKEFGGVVQSVSTKPKDWLKARIDPFGLNPLDLMNAKATERTSLLLGAIPASLDKDALKPIVDLCITSPNLDEHPLKVFAVIHKDLFDQRRNVNRDLKEKRATVEQVLGTVPLQDPDIDWPARVTAIEAERRKAEFELNNSAHQIELIKTQSIQEVKISSDRTCAAIGNQIGAEIHELELKIAELKRDIVDKQSAQHHQTAAAVSEIESRATANIAGLRLIHEPDITRLGEELAVAEQNKTLAIKAEQVRDTARSMREKADSLELSSNMLTSALETIEHLKGELLRNLPIRGIEIVDGELMVDGLPFDRVNESRRVSLAIEVAKLKAGEIQLVCVDGIECLDSHTFELFHKAAREADVQLIVTRVSDDPGLTIEVQ